MFSTGSQTNVVTNGTNFVNDGVLMSNASQNGFVFSHNITVTDNQTINTTLQPPAIMTQVVQAGKHTASLH